MENTNFGYIKLEFYSIVLRSEVYTVFILRIGYSGLLCKVSGLLIHSYEISGKNETILFSARTHKT